MDAGLAAERDARQHERRAELGLELARARSDSAAGSGCSSRRADESPRSAPASRRGRRPARRIASIVGWPSTPHGYGLIDTPGLTMRVRIAELADDAIGVEPVAEAEDLEESPRPIERVVAAGEALRRQLRGDDAVLRRAARRAAASSSCRS